MEVILNYLKKVNYSYSDMMYLDNNLKTNIVDFSLVRDFVIKEILSKNKDIYKDILILLIKDIIKLDKNNAYITFENIELGKSNYKEHSKIVDSYIKINNNIHIELECNTSPYNNVKLRNILYLNKISTKILEVGNKIIKDVIDMFSDGFRLCDWEKEKMIELVRQTTIQNAIDKAKKEGKLEGIQESINNTIKAMLTKNFSIEIISEITRKSFKEIKQIQNEMI